MNDDDEVVIVVTDENGVEQSSTTARMTTGESAFFTHVWKFEKPIRVHAGETLWMPFSDMLRQSNEHAG